MEKMTVAQVEAQLKKAKEWTAVGEVIQRTFIFPDFATSMKFVDAVAAAAEASQHHPDILIRYSKVTLTLATHDANGITHKDFDLAAKCDELAKKLSKKATKPA
jgi:4a-hydroxytetrahydrobiopterin dehydratase